MYLEEKLPLSIRAAAKYKVQTIADLLRMDADNLMAVMWHESKLNPKAKNPKGSATGLIQFLSSTAKALGTTTDALAAMTFVDQMDFVYLFLKPYKGRMNDLVESYMAVFYPSALGKPDTYRFPENVTRWNPIFDKFPKDGVTTKGEIAQHLFAMFPTLKKK